MTYGSSTVPARPLLSCGPVQGRPDAVGLVAPQHALDDLRVAVDVDAQRLPVRHPLRGGVGDVAAVEALHHVEELGPARLHAGRPPGAAGGRDERHPVALAGALLEEARHRRLRLVGLPGRDVHVVEHDDERAAPALLGGGVDRDPGRRRGRRGGLVGQLHRLERDDRLGHAVLDDGDVALLEPANRVALLVGDHHVHDDLLDLGRERGGRGLLGGPGRGGAAGLAAAAGFCASCATSAAAETSTSTTGAKWLRFMFLIRDSRRPVRLPPAPRSAPP